MPSRAAAVQDGRRPPPQAARSVLDGGEHDGILAAETDDEAANATFKNSAQSRYQDAARRSPQSWLAQYAPFVCGSSPPLTAAVWF